MAFKPINIQSLQQNSPPLVDTAPAVAEGHSPPPFLETMRKLFDDTIDHFVVTTLFKNKKATIQLFRESLMVVVESHDGSESRQIPMSYIAMSNPPRDPADQTRREWLIDLFNEAGTHLESHKCHVMVKKRSSKF